MRINNSYYDVDWKKFKRVSRTLDTKGSLNKLMKKKGFWKKLFKMYVGQIKNKNDVDYRNNRFLKERT